jgi:hypothetical protein
MMHLSLKHQGETSPKLSHHHLSGGTVGPPVPVASSLKHNKNLSSGSLGRDLDAWENAWEEDDESSEGDDGMDDHDINVAHLSSKSLLLPPGLHAAALPISQNQAVIPPKTDIQEKIKGSVITSDDESKVLESNNSTSESMSEIAWDSYSTGMVIPGKDEKPSVQMFLPMLRVLGKGSFGKVRTVVASCFINTNLILMDS